MNLEELTNRINESIDEMDLVTTRKYIEQNLDILKENKRYLKKNARELLEFIISRLEEGIKPLSRHELAAIKAINLYASNFDIRGLKLTIKDKTQLLIREDVLTYLNSDAKILLKDMGAISAIS
ncbi:hypothetical protein [Peribacillus kribbensis]|uniref:hypothetical protein n=1 Tax=Peribacillus kribbensis TaxID=356658 RepID=UPI0004091483|nr:hypothetical protein [Peribacillus kribbensis]